MIPFFRYLKRALYAHIITGLICGLIVGFYLVTNNYRKSVETVLEKIKDNLSRASQIREEDESLKVRIAFLKRLLPPDYYQKETELLILERLDMIKTEFPFYTVRVREFKSEGALLSLGFIAQGSIDNYKEFVKRLNSIEGPGLPSLSINRLTINITDEANTLQFSGTIKGLPPSLMQSPISPSPPGDRT